MQKTVVRFSQFPMVLAGKRVQLGVAYLIGFGEGGKRADPNPRVGSIISTIQTAVS